jgi:hypothetical protein
VGVNKDFAEHLDTDLSRVWSSPQPIPASEWMQTHLSLLNDGSTEQMNVDGSTETQRFQHIVPAGQRCILSRVIFTAVDLNILYTDWFGFGAALTNGIVVRAVDSDDNLVIQYNSALKITLDFAHLAGTDLPLLSVNRGTIPDVLVIRWSLYRSGFVPIFSAGDKIEVLVQDDLRAMDRFSCVLQGRDFDA